MSGASSESTGIWEVLSNHLSFETSFNWGGEGANLGNSESAGAPENWLVLSGSPGGSEPYEVEETLTIVDTIDIDVSGLFLLMEVVSLVCTLYLLLAFLYVRKINREQNIKPNCIHKFFCPLLSVLRWEGFDGTEPIYALLLGNIYTFIWWNPTTDEEAQAYTAVDGYTQMDMEPDSKSKSLLV